jgi:hypothetical protein
MGVLAGFLSRAIGIASRSTLKQPRLRALEGEHPLRL